MIEHGYIDDGPLTKIPHAAVTDYPNAALWGVRSAPVEHLNNATFGVTLADVVGGGSVINGMVADRGSKADYDAWETLGNEGWGFDGLLPYFRKSTNFTPLPEALAKEYGVVNDVSGYGGGPVQIGYPTTWFPDMKNVSTALTQYGIPVSQKPETGDAVGQLWTASTLDTRTGTRSHARVAYYDPVAARPNLRLLTGTEVTEVLLEDLTATGVAIRSRKDGSTARVLAKREVILAAGAISTPKLLQLSGIGPKKVLEAAGVAVKLDLAAVGANFQDHPMALTSWNLSNLAFPNENSVVANATYNATAWDEYLTNHTGPLTWARGVSAAFVPLKQVDPDAAASIVADVEAQDPLAYLPGVYGDDAGLVAGFRAQRAILVDHFARGDAAVAEFPFGGFAVVMGALQKPLSRGTVALNASAPRGHPVVHYNTLMNPADGRMLAGFARFIRGFYSQPAMAGYAPAELLPGPAAQTDADIVAALVAAGLVLPTLAHPSGTCAMMPARLGGCVAADLRVHGLRRLSVVDASVIPLIPATHIQTTVYAVAEKAADIIKAR